MKVLFDNCVSRQSISCLAGHQVAHAVDKGWASLTNGDLIRRAAAEFDVLVTVDKTMQFQSSLKGVALRVAVLNVPSNDFELLKVALARLQDEIESLQPGSFSVISAADRP